jgi:hypothetical protein
MGVSARREWDTEAMSTETDDGDTGCGLPFWVWGVLFVVGPVLEVSGTIASSGAVFADYFEKPAAVLDKVTVIYVGATIVVALISAIILAIKRDGVGSFVMTSYVGLSLLAGLAFGYTQTYFRFLF